MSPHPDDLVFSAFSALSCDSPDLVKLGLVFFNLSTSTRWGTFRSRRPNLPVLVVSLMRTVEDKMILGYLGVKTIHLQLNDSKTRENKEPPVVDSIKALSHLQFLSEIYCPLGIGGHPDHLFVRSAAIKLWNQNERKAKLFFYEDLPYAFLARNVKEKEEECFERISKENRTSISIKYSPLTSQELSRKLRFMRLYFTQMDHTSLDRFASHAESVGRDAGFDYAEKFASASSY